MDAHIVYLFYLSLVLALGVLITGVSHRFRCSNILFLVLAGYLLARNELAYFSSEIIIILSSLALILIVLETTMELDLSHILRNSFHVLKFSVVFFLICTYGLTLLAYQLLPVDRTFEGFVLCLLLAILLYGVDPLISLEFFETRKKKVWEMLELEGIISGPIVVIFSLFIINYLTSTASFSLGLWSTALHIFKEAIYCLLVAVALSYIVSGILKHFISSKELRALTVITFGIITFTLTETLGANGSLAVAMYGIFLRGFLKEHLSKTATALFAHTLYIIVFILVGMKLFFPSVAHMGVGLLLFSAYLLLRYMCVWIFYRTLPFREKLFMTLNVAKGIEVALVLFIMDIEFSHILGLHLVLSMGFFFFVLSYILSTIVSHFRNSFFHHYKKPRF